MHAHVFVQLTNSSFSLGLRQEKVVFDSDTTFKSCKMVGHRILDMSDPQETWRRLQRTLQAAQQRVIIDF